MVVAIEVKPSERVGELRREAHGRGNGFVITDTLLCKHVLLVQRLTDAVHFLNAQPEQDAVCVASMYEAANNSLRKVHRRWVVEKVKLDDAVPLFEQKRKEAGYKHSYVLGQPHRMRLVST